MLIWLLQFMGGGWGGGGGGGGGSESKDLYLLLPSGH